MVQMHRFLAKHIQKQAQTCRLVFLLKCLHLVTKKSFLVSVSVVRKPGTIMSCNAFISDAIIAFVPTVIKIKMKK